MTPAILALEDGTIFHGRAIGAIGEAVGEVVFNTAMTGYQEIVSDPSYARQIVTLTCPHIGNVGANDEDIEAQHAYACGLVVRDYPSLVSNFRSQESLKEFLLRQNVVGISDVDTRQLTRVLREKGAQSGCLQTGSIDETRAVDQAQVFAGLKGMDLAKTVTTEKPYIWEEGTWQQEGGFQGPGTRKWRVVAYDFGVKQNILRMLVDRGCQLTVVPAQTSASEVLAMNPDGVFLSNGPGDPEPCDYAIDAIKKILQTDTPVFGICLGHQLMGLASGLRTYKLRYGHRGGNQPVLDLQTQKVSITSQNHGFAVEDPVKGMLAPHPSGANSGEVDNLTGCDVEVRFINANDRTVEGLDVKGRPAFTIQYHPEACPGPHDANPLFDRFENLVADHMEVKANAKTR